MSAADTLTPQLGSGTERSGVPRELDPIGDQPPRGEAVRAAIVDLGESPHYPVAAARALSQKDIDSAVHGERELV